MELIKDTIDLAARKLDLGLGGRGAHLAIPSILGPILASVLVFNRVYWRISLVHTVGLDDLCICLSLAFLFALCMTNLVAVDHGYGRQSHTISTTDLHIALQMFYLDQIFYKFTINLTKLSILCLYLRIFSQPWFRNTCWLSVVLVISYAVSSITATVFQCTPIPRVWNKNLPGTCINITAFWYANAIFNIVTDIVILGSVPPVIWKLRLPRRQKIGLTVVFGLGGFVFATSILRMTTLDVSSKSLDPTQGTLISTMWTTIEASTAVVCACLPMLRTPLQRLVPKLFPSRYASGTGAANDKHKALKAAAAAPKPAFPTGPSDVRNHTTDSSDPTTMPSEDEGITLTNAGRGDIRSEDGSRDLEMCVASQPQPWPPRLSSINELSSSDNAHFAQPCQSPLAPLQGHHRPILSLSSECEPASPNKVRTTLKTW